VFRTLYSILGADEDVRDLLQEVFLRGLRGIDKLRDVERVKSWLDTIAVFVASKRLRLRRFLRAARAREAIEDWIRAGTTLGRRPRLPPECG
jgi:DNA-directed RNA polymerase specialized sigma24 family protein